MFDISNGFWGVLFLLSTGIENSSEEVAAQWQQQNFLVAIALVSANAVAKRAAVAIIPTSDCKSEVTCV